MRAVYASGSTRNVFGKLPKRFRRLRNCFRCSQRLSGAPETVPGASKVVPDAPKSVPDAPKTVPDAPKTVPDAPKTVPDAPKTVPDALEVVPDVPETFWKVPEDFWKLRKRFRKPTPWPSARASSASISPWEPRVDRVRRRGRAERLGCTLQVWTREAPDDPPSDSAVRPPLLPLLWRGDSRPRRSRARGSAPSPALRAAVVSRHDPQGRTIRACLG